MVDTDVFVQRARLRFNRAVGSEVYFNLDGALSSTTAGDMWYSGGSMTYYDGSGARTMAVLNAAQTFTATKTFQADLYFGDAVAGSTPRAIGFAGGTDDTLGISATTLSLSSGTATALTVTSSIAAGNAVSIAADSVTTGRALDLSAAGLTTGYGLSITGPSSGSAMTGRVASITSYLGSGGRVLSLSGTSNPAAAGTMQGLYSYVDDATALGNIANAVEGYVWGTGSLSAAGTKQSTGGYFQAYEYGGSTAGDVLTYGVVAIAAGNSNANSWARAVYGAAYDTDNNYGGSFSAEQWDVASSHRNVGVQGEAHGTPGFGNLYGVIGLADTTEFASALGVLASIETAVTLPTTTNAALYATGGGVGYSGYFTGGQLYVTRTVNGSSAAYVTNGGTSGATGMEINVTGAGAGNRSGLVINAWMGQTTSYGVKIIATVDPVVNAKSYGVFSSGLGNGAGTTSYGAYCEGISGDAAYGVYGDGASGTNTYGVYGNADSGATNYGVYGNASQNGVPCYGVYGQAKNGNTCYGVYGSVTPDVVNPTTAYGVYGGVTVAATTSYGVYGSATAGTTRYAGFFENNQQFKIPDWGAVAPTRTVDGCIGTATVGGVRRMYLRTGGVNRYINTDAGGDYSEFFATQDPGLAVGEVVAFAPEIPGSVRRARPLDGDRVVGVVSLHGSRNNDDPEGLRALDDGWINVGLLGQIPVLVTEENGPIRPGDPLTLSARWRGRAARATGPCRIIGYALTHFPYVEGEKTWCQDVSGSKEDSLSGDHVLCHVDPSWYESAAEGGEGEEPPPQPSWREAFRRSIARSE